MMLGEASESADYWKECGDEALANGIKGVIMMVGPTLSSIRPLVWRIVYVRCGRVKSAPLRKTRTFDAESTLTHSVTGSPLGCER